MPRQRRKQSATDIYHAIIRGNGKMDIFIDDEDKRKFTSLLKRFIRETGGEIHGQCAMDNHAHMLLKMPFEDLSLFMKKLTVSYAHYFNRKYDRVGHVFQDRFKSVPVETHRHYLAVLRYIHRNPIAAGISKNYDYEWSSYSDYLHGSSFINTSFALELLGGIKGFLRFHNSVEDEGEFMEAFPPRRYISDASALRVMEKFLGASPIARLLAMDKFSKRTVASKLNGLGISYRQLSRLTGLSRSMLAAKGA